MVEYELEVSNFILNSYILRPLQAFDELLLLKRGGRVIYGGATGSRSDTLIAYFQAVPDVPPVSEGVNPATWMLEVCTSFCRHSSFAAPKTTFDYVIEGRKTYGV